MNLDTSSRIAHCTVRSRKADLDALAHLAPAARDAFLERATSQVLPAGQLLFEQEAKHRASYLILTGLVRIYYVAPSGREVTLAYWEDGDFVGGPDLFGAVDHVWSGIARKQTRVLSVRGPDLKALAQRHPAILWWVTGALTRKLQWLSILFQLHGTEHVPQRLAKLLLLLADNYGIATEEGTLIRYWENQGDLATLLGASRQWTNRTLHEFERSRLLAFHNRHIVITNEPALRHLNRMSEPIGP